MQLVWRMIQILLILYKTKHKTGLNINLIIKETGSSNKPGIIKAIKILEENKIIFSIETAKHKQMSIKQLTAFGLELGQLIENIHNYYKSRYIFNRKLNSLLKIQ